MINIINIIASCILPLIVCFVFVYAITKKVPVYEEFINGAKEGFNVAIKIIPYIVAIMVAVGMFRASGAIDFIARIFAKPLDYLKIPIDVVPMILTRSLSGGATLGVFSDIVSNTGANSYASKLAGVIIGSSETTFYVLAVYFGSVGIKKFRHAILCGILADLMGIILAVIVCRFLFL